MSELFRTHSSFCGFNYSFSDKYICMVSCDRKGRPYGTYYRRGSSCGCPYSKIRITPKSFSEGLSLLPVYALAMREVNPIHG